MNVIVIYFTNFPNTFLTNGPAKKICQHSAIGKFIAVVCNQTAIISFPGCLNNTVAIKLIAGHIRQTIIDEIARITAQTVAFVARSLAVPARHRTVRSPAVPGADRTARTRGTHAARLAHIVRWSQIALVQIACILPKSLL